MPGESLSFANDQEHLRLLIAMRESELLRELAELVASSLDLASILSVLVKRTTEVCEVERCTVWLLEDADKVFNPATYYLSSQCFDSNSVKSAEAAWSSSSLPFDNPVLSRLFQTQHMLVLDDLLVEPSMRTLAEKFLVRSVLLVPLIREGRPVGVMTLDDPNKIRTFSTEQQRLAHTIGQYAAIAIDTARLHQQVQTEHRRAEQLIERANTLDAIFHTMTEGITVCNQDGEVLIVNNAASHFLGVPLNSKDHLKAFLSRYPVYTLHGQPISDEDFPLSRALRGERIRAERFVTVRSDGSERIIEMNIAPMFDKMKKQTAIVCAFRDISEQIRVEQRMRHALETMLHVAEAVSGMTKISDILSSVLQMAMTTLNCDRGIVQLYDQEQEIFTPLLSAGFSVEQERQWIANQSTWLTPGQDQYQGFRSQLMDGYATIVSEENYPHQPNLFNDVMVLAAPITHNNHLLGLMSLDRSLPSGEQEDSAVAPNTIYDQQRRDFTIWDMAVVEGITQLAGLAIEQARWQQEAENARTSEAAMREANTLKDEFLSITAHEFRTPLTVILAHSQIALRTLRRMTDQDQAGKLSENLSTIEEQTRQLTNIVNTFLEVTQLNRGQLKLKFEEVDLADIAKQVVLDHSATSAAHQICCSVEPCEYPYIVQGDSARLLQVLANLVQNAMKYSPLGGPITITVGQWRNGNDQANIEVCVADKGIGVPKEAQSRLFERFYRAPNIEGSKTKGIGLGLYVVAELLRMHSGTIRVESSGIPGEGSRFIFTLPRIEGKSS